MKTIGLIGGMSWESSVRYYQLINRGVQQRLGGLHSARLLLHSVDFAEIEAQQSEGRWDDAATLLADAGRSLVAGGAAGIVICTNTMHKVADAVQQAAGVPLLHIADATGDAVRATGLKRIALLGTRFTMEQDFYRARLEERFDIDVLIPPDEDREIVHRVIYDELCRGIVGDTSRVTYLEIIRGLQRRGAEGVILGCTEIGMLVSEENSPLPVFDSARIHAEAAVEFLLDPPTM
ncbi:MAG: aspartate/glutamate racemase family protein [Proteobacteria bacterium]|nr:aspartate/glutamate racemase family protein [Pseudomonadota bacterium]